jgi:hypothetical protein
MRERQAMQSEEPTQNARENVIAAGRTRAEFVPQDADALVQTSTGLPRKRRTARRLYQRKRQRLQQLLQPQAPPPVSQ